MKIKYFLRGLGFGILITSLLLGTGTKKSGKTDLNDSQVIERAKELGMLTKEEVKDYKMETALDNIKDSMSSDDRKETETEVTAAPEKEEKKEENKKDSTSTGDKDSSNKKTSTAEKKEDSSKKKNKNSRKTISITIEPGMVSQSIAKYLYQKNVIGSASDFNSYMQEHKVTEKLRAGEYEIPVDASYKEIVDIIT